MSIRFEVNSVAEIIDYGLPDEIILSGELKKEIYLGEAFAKDFI